MAAGRHGSYRDHEFRARESDLEASRRKDYYQGRSRDSDRESNRTRDFGDRVDIRQRGSKEKESLDGSARSPLSGNSSGGGSGSDRKRGVFFERSADREPGELSSGSGSDDPEAVTTATRSSRENGGWKHENVDTSMESKRRKFSPIVWDRGDAKRSGFATSRSKNGTFAPPPPLPHEYVPPSNSSGMVWRPTEQASRSDVKVSVDSPDIMVVGYDREPGQVEEDEEDIAAVRDISTSRWADSNNAIEDNEAGALSEVVTMSQKDMPLLNSVEQRLQKKDTSPELGEVLRKRSVEAASKPSDSEGGHGDVQKEIEVHKKDYMDVDGEEADRDASDHLSNTDSEDPDGRTKTPEPLNPPHRNINMLQGCRSVDEFERLNKIDEGTYGVVYRAKDRKSGEIVALKKVKMEKEREGFPLTSLREINILLSFHHPSIVDVKEIVVGSSLDSIFMVMEYMEHDLKGLMETMKQPFSQSEVKCLMLQLLEGVKYLHDNWVLHRDLKTSNLLLNNRGELKICDFGLSRQYGSPLKPYTHLVVTLWYRSPELLLGAKEYSTPIDMWSLGCIMAELLAKEPLFSGKTEFDQLDKIFRTLGTPNEKIWPGFAKLPGVKVNFVKQPHPAMGDFAQASWLDLVAFPVRYNKLREKFPPTSFSGRPTLSEAGFDLLNKLLTYDPERRITADAALNHDWFREVPLPKSKDFMPTFPAQHARDRRLRRNLKSPDPLEEQRRKELQQGDLISGSLFG